MNQNENLWNKKMSDFTVVDTVKVYATAIAVVWTAGIVISAWKKTSSKVHEIKSA